MAEMEILKLIAISEFNGINSYGEGIAVIENLTYLSEKNIEKYKQLFHYIIQRIMGYSVPPVSVISRELKDSGKKRPNSLFYGFFEFKYGNNGPYESWTYYRIYYKRSEVVFIKNNGEEIIFPIVSHGVFLTHNYCVIMEDEETLSIYHKYLSRNHRLYYGFSPISMIVRVIERPNELMFIYYNIDGKIDIMLYSFSKEYFVAPDFFKPVSHMNRFMCGFLGFYLQSGDNLICQSYSGEKIVVPGMPANLINKVFFVKNIINQSDFIYTSLSLGFMYHSHENRITWSREISCPRIPYCDSFLLIDDSVVDLITGGKLFSTEYKILCLTRKDDGSGYWVWVSE